LTQDPEAALHRTIGLSIREERQAQGLTLKQLARRTGLSSSLLSQIERAESSASISSLFRIATALNLRMCALFEKAAPRVSAP
jgi:transcriptional regulator with XRE-family HTH domain